VTDDKGTVADNEVAMSNEEFIEREPDFVGAAVQSSVIRKWILNTGSAKYCYRKSWQEASDSEAYIGTDASNNEQYDTLWISSWWKTSTRTVSHRRHPCQKSQHSNLLVETDEDGHEDLLQEQEPCDEEIKQNQVLKFLRNLQI
jgi:hypothetical protein